MSYLVLARKWRPQSLADMVGQQHIARVLTNAIQSERIAHCYLFTGVRGVGKTSAARILAKALNCVNGPTPTPCNECPSCREIADGGSLDVYEIDGASNRGIDEVRQIIENVRYKPAAARFKVYIIDEVHQVTRDAFNALLKTLEEPPDFAKFILATTEVHRLPETILSRCQRFDFRRIGVQDIHERLRQIAEVEGLNITDGALTLLSRAAQGSMRDAQSLLEQVLSFADPEADGTVDEPLLRDILGVAERRVLYEVSAAIIAGNPAACLDLVAEVATHGVDLAALSRELVEHFRNLLVLRLMDARTATPGAGPDTGSRRLMDLTAEEMALLREQARDVDPETLINFYRFVVQGDDIVSRSPYPRFDLEVALVRVATLPRTVNITDAIDELRRLERKLDAGASDEPGGAAEREQRSMGVDMRPGRAAFREEAPRPAVAAPQDAMPPQADPATPPDRSAEDTRTPAPPLADEPTEPTPAGWNGFVEFVNGEKPMLGSSLQQARLLELSGDNVRLGLEEGFHLRYLADRETVALLEGFLARYFKRPMTVAVAADSGGQGGTGTAQDGDDDGTVDIVDEAQRIFGGSVK
ncbi:MAG: DNA polymerase III subunit gamma/tau [Deltaproteobacteria bacterium]|nr:DNA polymerase III subunit gamma/tau [Deltaproteobacteria bacterium]